MQTNLPTVQRYKHSADGMIVLYRYIPQHAAQQSAHLWSLVMIFFSCWSQAAVLKSFWLQEISGCFIHRVVTLVATNTNWRDCGCERFTLVLETLNCTRRSRHRLCMLTIILQILTIICRS